MPTPISLFIFCAASAGLCALFLALTVRAARRAEALLESSRAVTCTCSSRLESLVISLSETQDALSVLANKVKMQKVRNAATHVRADDELPADVASLKSALRRRAGLVAGQPPRHRE